MDPKLHPILMDLATRLRASNPRVAQEITQYVLTNGDQPLSASTLVLVEPFLRQRGLTLTGAPGAGAGVEQAANAVANQPAVTGPPPVGSVPRIGPGNAPAIAHDPNGNPAGYVPASPTPVTIPAGTPGTPGSGDPLVGAAGLRPDQRFANSPGAPAYATDPRNSGMPVAAQQSAGANGNQPAGSGSSTLPGGFSAAQGNQLSTDDYELLRFAVRAAGFDPDVLTPATKIAMQALKPLVQARRAAFAGNSADQNTGGLPQDIASFAREFTTPGTDFYGHARQYAQGVLGGKTFQDFLGGLSDPMDQFNMVQALTPLLYGGSNPMIRQSVSDQMQRQQGLYSDQNFNNAGTPAGNMSILDFIRNQPNLNPALRSIFGPQQ